MRRIGFSAIVICLLNACSLFSPQPLSTYHLVEMQHLLHRDNWFFAGRIVIANDKDSISATINWRHQIGQDNIELMGPLAQGRVQVAIFADKVVIDDGERRQELSGPADMLLTERLGVEIPANSLRFWVLGVNDPGQIYAELSDGFIQNGWTVRYKELQQVNKEQLPRKIYAEKINTKVKLVIDEWEL